MQSKNLPLVVIFGRTNVGKSTLFNCLIEKHQALVSKKENTTRDSNIGKVEWRGIKFQLVDTGGLTQIKNFILRSRASDFRSRSYFDEVGSVEDGQKSKIKNQKNNQNDIESQLNQQVLDYLKQADLILFLVDNKTGILPQDKIMAEFLVKTMVQSQTNLIFKRILLVVNKVDNIKNQSDAAEFNKLNLGEPIPVSAANGSGTGDLLDIITKSIKLIKQPKIYKKIKFQIPSITMNQFQASNLQPIISVCIIGKPNVGKSSLLNSLVGYNRVIVTDIPHTTREPQDTILEHKNHYITLVDTAGISKQGKKAENLIKHGILKSLQALQRANIALLVIDINQEITHQDAKLAEEIIKRKKSIIIIANKWDLILEKDVKKYTKYIYAKLPFITWAPILFVSALTNKGVKKILDLILNIIEQRNIELNDSQLNKFLQKIVKIHRPIKAKGVKHPRIYKLKQIKTNPPLFSIRIGIKDTLHVSYSKFIENRLREEFKIIGTPINIHITIHDT